VSIGIDKGEGEEASRERNQGEADQRRRFDGDGGARDGDGDGGREELGFGKGVSLERRGEDEQMDKYARAEQGWPARGTRLAGGGGDVGRAAIRALPTEQSKTGCSGFSTRNFRNY